MKTSFFSLRGISVLLGILAFCGCSNKNNGGTVGGNPAVTNVTVQMGPNTNADVSVLNLCISSLQLVPQGGGSPVVIATNTGLASVSSANTTLTQARVTQGNYQQINAVVSSGCGSASSFSWTNLNGSFNASSSVTMSFTSSFAVNSSTTSLVLEVQAFANQLAAAASSSQGATALSSTSGTVSIGTTAAGLNLEVPIELLDTGAASTTASHTFNRSRTSLDTADYDGTVTYQFEVVTTNSDSVARNVSLQDTSGSTVATISVPAATTNETRLRTVFMPTSGASDYRVYLDGTTSSNQLTVYTARMLVQQVGATQTKIYIPLSSYNNVVFTTDDSTAYTAGASSSTYSQGDVHTEILWNKNDSAFSQLAAGTPWTFEAVISTDVAGTSTAYASLFDESASAQVAASEISTTSTTPTLVSVSFSDTAGSFTNLDNFDFKNKNVGGTTAYLYRAGLWAKLTNLAHAEVYYRYLEGYWNTSGTGVHSPAEQRILLDTASFTSGTLYNDVTGYVDQSGTSCTQTMYNVGTSDTSTTGSTVSGSVITINSTTKTRQRTNPLAISSGTWLISETSANPVATA